MIMGGQSTRPFPGAILLREIAPHWAASLRLLNPQERRVLECLSTIFILIRKTVKNCGTTNEAVLTLQKMAVLFRDPEDLEAQYSITHDFPNFEMAVRAWKELSLFLDTSIPREYFLEHLMGLETEIRRLRPQSESELLLDLYRQVGTIALAAGHALKLNEKLMPALADLANSIALSDSRVGTSDGRMGGEFLAPLSWNGRETTERNRLAAVFFASGRKGLSHLPLRFRLFLFLPLRHDFHRGKKSSLRSMDQVFDELIVQTFSSIGLVLKSSTPINVAPLNPSRSPAVFDATLIVRNQMTRIGMFPQTQSSKLHATT
ncbi:MAG: hypothetical protein U1E10_01880 [Bdellovibrionales bacterium]|nr:hypothetical protein [Bdellovibrionales bacterium]